VFRKKEDVDHRVKPGDDSFLWRLKKQLAVQRAKAEGL